MPVFTPVWNGLGLPALSVPIGFNDAGLPAGMQLVAGPFDEAMVLRVGDGYQRRTNWHLQTPDPVGQ
jgi:aspartyl-tRNA(Asn)/glutamyl-tRNA(Gln) amidotransferase subunit A